MLNIIDGAKEYNSSILELTGTSDQLQNIFSEKVFSELLKVREGGRDNLVVRNLPVPEILASTPAKIQADVPDIFPKYLVESTVSFLGELSDKKIENTIRFRLEETGKVNIETWHGHAQFQFSVFFCLRGDSAAKTYFLSARDIIESAPEDISKKLLFKFEFIKDQQPFSLIEKTGGGYKFNRFLYEASDFEKLVPNLDLPDASKFLKSSTANTDSFNAVSYLFTKMNSLEEFIVYKPGDLAVYNEAETMRFSPAYTPSSLPEKDRWILSGSVI